MTAVLVDTNVLLDVMTEDPEWFAWSRTALERAGDRSRLVVNPIVFAEVSVQFARLEDLDEALPKEIFDREPIPYEAAFLAGKAFVIYRKRGGIRRSPLPDFFIGAHAAIADYTLLTRDAARFRSYFPTLSLMAPE